MTAGLDAWQGRLENHFKNLAASRNSGEFPLFAMEHGLTQEDLRQSTDLLHSSLLREDRPSRHWLVWVVYATELGYDYDGEEYWQTFEDRTPLWRDRASRGQLRDWFHKFHKTFGGVEPTGAWADWFTIIAWPITHAILPKYLQLQLARTLFTLRYDLAALQAFEAATIGRLLARNAWDASSRLKILLEQQELAGRIVLALLTTKSESAPAPIFDVTLRRIAKDLEEARRGRDWLRETRRVVADRFEGVGRPAPKSFPRGTETTSTTPGVLRPAPPANIRPSVLLRRSSAVAWSPYVEISGFAALSRVNPDLRAFLRQTRCRVRGTGDMWLPAGWTLAGSPRRLLKTWPGSKEALVSFERPQAALDHLLQSECRLSAGTVWLFRIGADDIAREVVGRFVRCEQSYLLVSETQLIANPDLVRECALSCSEAFGYFVSVPETLATGDITYLQTLSLQVGRTIRIWPAALLSRGWDGEGHSEWLTSETPSFGIVHDHPVTSYNLRLNAGPVTTIGAKAPGAPTFVQLPRLPPGRHVLAATVNRAHNSVASVEAQIAEGIVELVVREPIPWIPGTTSHVGLSVMVDPSEPTIDEFWNEDVEMSVHGPTGYHIHCDLSLYRANGEEMSCRNFGSFDLPVSPASWMRKLHDFVNSESKTWAHLEAASGILRIRGEELGEYCLPLTREIKPVRWVCKTTHDVVHLRLIDDTGRDEPLLASLIPFDDPLNPKSIDPIAAMTGITCSAPGGLFSASKGTVNDAMIVSPPQIAGGLEGLGLKIDVEAMSQTEIDVPGHLSCIEQWMKTPLVGPLASLRRDRVVRALCQHLYARLCGMRWARAEAAFLNDPESTSALNHLVESVDRAAGFAIVLQRDHARTQGGSRERSHWFLGLARSFRVCSDPHLVEFALKLAGQPQQIAATKTDELEKMLGQVGDKTVLLRGARLLALLDIAKRAGGVGSAVPRWTCRS
jgi:hypothetical protein